MKNNKRENRRAHIVKEEKFGLLYGQIFSILCILSLYLLSFAAFPTKVRQAIKKEANGKCDVCRASVGYNKLVAAHIYHGKGSQYNKRENGRAHCYYCEAEYHLKHALDPKIIGLNRKQNDPVVYGHVLQLSEDDRNFLTQKYYQQWDSVLRRMKR